MAAFACRLLVLVQLYCCNFGGCKVFHHCSVHRHCDIDAVATRFHLGLDCSCRLLASSSRRFQTIALPPGLHRSLSNFLAETVHHCSLHGFLVCLLAPLAIMLKTSSTLCTFLALASKSLMFRESSSSFVSPVDTTFLDARSHLFPTRSLLTPSAACLSISFTSMRVGFTPRRLISLECSLVQPWVTVSDAQSNIAEWRPAASTVVLHVDGAAVDLHMVQFSWLSQDTSSV